MEIITRFAPSPTGTLHLGGARTALYNYLFAKQNKGKFLLRIEDTDVDRTVDGAVSNILDDLKWLGLQWDNEGSEPFQSTRLDIYHTICNSMIEKGLAYFCNCSSEELQEYKKTLPEGKDQKGFYYHGKHRGNKTGDFTSGKWCVRLDSSQLPTNLVVLDTVFGERKILLNRDEVIVRSDGIPTYNFACAVDDSLMNVTNVIRGSDHLQNTTTQVLIINSCFGMLPTYTHLPMMMKDKHEKLAKRNASVAISEYRANGYSPESVLSYIARFGWRTGGNQELFTLSELVEKFNISRIHPADGIFDPVKFKKLDEKWKKLTSKLP